MTKFRPNNSVYCTWSYRNSFPPSTRSQFKDLDHFVRVLCSSARSQLFLVAPYLSAKGLKGLRTAIAKSVENGAWIRLVTSDVRDPAGDNYRAVRALVSGSIGQLIRPRLRVLAGTATMPELLHAKIIICDGTQGYLGSANLSQSAFDRNFEVGVALVSAQVRALERLLSFFESRGFLEDCTDEILAHGSGH
jgi:phosphatidylserine/phosphatidylglycerophosphate/cardiolipin synthase-like enzyme